MPTPIVSVENLSKRYLVGHHSEGTAGGGYQNFRDMIERGVRNAGRKALDVVRGRQVVQGDTVEEFWALKDVSFEVQQGEVLGIVGHNGAGKSTLLKILGRITEPTSGRVTLRGRVASLLEVGTGFHPELSGRENIYLNGAILGMSRFEIRKKFDEIVAFAEVEKFLDTPTKRYSSGMYVRLAFAVAAHLEPEILIVDEVLAVGDTEFQKKCLGKMQEVSHREGRTVLFVSHNMETVLKLCGRGMLLKAGEVVDLGEASNIVSGYLRHHFSADPEVHLIDKPRPFGPPRVLRLSRARAVAPQGDWSFPFGRSLTFDLWIESAKVMENIEVAIGLFSAKGYEIASWTNLCSNASLATQPGLNAIRIEYEDLRLLPGQYSLHIGVRATAGGALDDYIPDAVTFEVVASAEAAVINSRTFGGSLVPRVRLSKVEPVSVAATPAQNAMRMSDGVSK